MQLDIHYSPFDALGVRATALSDPEQVLRAFRLAHRQLLRRQDNPPLFPTLAEVNIAKDVLVHASATPSSMGYLVRRWAARPRTFFAERALGAADVFTATSATAPPAAATATAPPRRRGRSASPSQPIIISDDEEEEENDPSFIISSDEEMEDVVNMDDDDDDGDSDGDASPQPMPAPRSGPATATANTRAARARPAAATGPSNPRRTPIQRSAQGSTRRPATRNPNTTSRIIVGTWARSPNNPPHAVAAGLDARGRLNYRIQARTLGGVAVAASTTTAVSIRGINFIPRLRSLLPNALHDLIRGELNGQRLT